MQHFLYDQRIFTSCYYNTPPGTLYFFCTSNSAFGLSQLKEGLKCLKARPHHRHFAWFRGFILWQIREPASLEDGCQRLSVRWLAQLGSSNNLVSICKLLTCHHDIEYLTVFDWPQLRDWFESGKSIESLNSKHCAPLVQLSYDRIPRF